MAEKQIIGIDVSSKKLNIHFLGRNLDFEIANSEEAIREFISSQGLDSANCVIGAESTGRYHLLCQEIFVRKGFEFRLINPILTGKKIASSIRKKKTDESDARFVALIILEGEGRIVKSDQLDVSRRTLLRTRTRIVGQRTGIKVIIQELQMIKGDKRIEKTINALNKLVKQMDGCVAKIEDESLDKEEITDNEKLIRSIPGFAVRLSAVIACEVEDFSRFPSANEFKAYVGIDPKVTQSGGSLKTGRITKRGNAHLRSAFYLAAQVARCHDPELKEFYKKKKAEGKHTRVAIIAVARKLCERVFAVVKKQKPYEIRIPDSQPALA